MNSDDVFKYKQGKVYDITLNSAVYTMIHENWYSISELNNVIPEKILKKDFISMKEDRKIKLNLL